MLGYSYGKRFGSKYPEPLGRRVTRWSGSEYRKELWGVTTHMEATDGFAK
jgi:hypothetical protein